MGRNANRLFSKDVHFNGTIWCIHNLHITARHPSLQQFGLPQTGRQFYIFITFHMKKKMAQILLLKCHKQWHNTDSCIHCWLIVFISH